MINQSSFRLLAALRRAIWFSSSGQGLAVPKIIAIMSVLALKVFSVIFESFSVSDTMLAIMFLAVDALGDPFVSSNNISSGLITIYTIQNIHKKHYEHFR